MVISIQRFELLLGHQIKGTSHGMWLDVSPGGLRGEMRRAVEVSSDGKLFQEIKEQVGNRAAK